MYVRSLILHVQCCKQEAFISELEEIHETYEENELSIEGEYASEPTMVSWGWTANLILNEDCNNHVISHANLPRKRIEAVKKYCAANPKKFLRLGYMPSCCIILCSPTVAGVIHMSPTSSCIGVRSSSKEFTRCLAATTILQKCHSMYIER